MCSYLFNRSPRYLSLHREKKPPLTIRLKEHIDSKRTNPPPPKATIMGAFDAATKKLRKKMKHELREDEDEEDEDNSLVIGSEESDRSTVPSDNDNAEEEEVAAKPAKKGSKKAAAAATAVAPADAAQLEFNEPAQWVERMALTSTRSLPADLSADDDPKREEAFIQQALLSVSRGVSMLEQAGVPWRRPEDYYAEMFKSDVHMNDVRQAMDASKSRIEAQAHRRAMKDQKKYGKEVQAEVLRQRAKYKRDMADRISDWKKKRKGSGGLNDFLGNDEEADGGGGGGGRKGSGGGGKRGPTGPKPRNMQPGGGSRKRPGKNARGRN